MFSEKTFTSPVSRERAVRLSTTYGKAAIKKKKKWKWNFSRRYRFRHDQYQMLAPLHLSRNAFSAGCLPRSSFSFFLLNVNGPWMCVHCSTTFSSSGHAAAFPSSWLDVNVSLKHTQLTLFVVCIYSYRDGRERNIGCLCDVKLLHEPILIWNWTHRWRQVSIKPNDWKSIWMVVFLCLFFSKFLVIY